VAVPAPRIGKYAAGLKNPHPANSERQPRNAAWHNAQEAAMMSPGLINRAAPKKNSGPLTTKKRKALPTSTFALPGRRYPINDPNHARNALSRVSANGTPAEKAKVRSAVKRKYPGIGKK
jgi:hypothetical protein